MAKFGQTAMRESDILVVFNMGGTGMKELFSLVGAAGILFLGSAAHADNNAHSALTDAKPGAFSSGPNDRLDHNTAKLRFQSTGGIAIKGGKNANYEKSALREAGDGFGAVVEAPGQMDD